jgi:hypothetical protein
MTFAYALKVPHIFRLAIFTSDNRLLTEEHIYLMASAFSISFSTTTTAAAAAIVIITFIVVNVKKKV